MPMSEHSIRLYNTLSNQIETFRPVEGGCVRMYNCGPTVYDYAHIGNFRSFLFADLLRRVFEFHGFQVTQVMNLTDVGHMTEDQLADGGGEDKMQVAAERLKEAKKSGRAPIDDPDDPFQVARYYGEAFLTDARLLGMRVAEEPEHLPAATHHIGHMIEMIETLIKAGHAYRVGDAVYYDVQSFPEYGQLSGNTLDKVREGAGGRVATGDQAGKRHPADFLLWKLDDKHLMKWPSPWGVGYPGWHIECSAMAIALHSRLAHQTIETIDIHTGGEDNIFPHHECEIAQSKGATGKTFANYWMHARHLMVEGEKMSKSKGNFFTVRDLLARGASANALRLTLLTAPYRQNFNFTFAGLAASEKMIERMRGFVAHEPDEPDPTSPKMGESEVELAFAEALADDLNISKAMGVLNTWMKSIARPGPEEVAALKRIDHAVLDVLTVREPSGAMLEAMGLLPDAVIAEKCRALDAARADKDFATSDRLRDELIAAGIEVRISKEGTTWKRRIAAD